VDPERGIHQLFLLAAQIQCVSTFFKLVTYAYTPNTMLTLPIPSSKVSSQCEFFYFCLDALITHLFPMSGSTLSTIPTTGLIPQSTVSNLLLQRRPRSSEAGISRTEAEALLPFLSNPFALHVCPTNDPKSSQIRAPRFRDRRLPGSKEQKASLTMPPQYCIRNGFLFSIVSLSSFRSVAIQVLILLTTTTATFIRSSWIVGDV